MQLKDISQTEETQFLFDVYSKDIQINILFDILGIFQVLEICDSKTKRWIMLPKLLIGQKKRERTDICIVNERDNSYRFVCFFSDIEKNIVSDRILYDIGYENFHLCFVNKNSKPLISPHRKADKIYSAFERNLIDTKPGDKIFFEKKSSTLSGIVVNAFVKPLKENENPPQFFQNPINGSLSKIVILIKLTKPRKKNKIIDLTDIESKNQKRKSSSISQQESVSENGTFYYLLDHHIQNIVKIDIIKISPFLMLDHYIFKMETIIVLLIPEYPMGRIVQTSEKSVKIYFEKYKLSLWIDVVKFKNWKIFESEQSAFSWIHSRLESIKLLEKARPGDFILSYPNNFSFLSCNHISNIPTYQIIKEITKTPKGAKKISFNTDDESNDDLMNFLDEDNNTNQIVKIPEYNEMISDIDIQTSDKIVKHYEVISVIFSKDKEFVRSDNELNNCRINSEVVFETTYTNLNNNSFSTVFSKIKRITNEGVLIGERFFLPPFPSNIRCSKIY
jgi:hypothetical protein